MKVSNFKAVIILRSVTVGSKISGMPNVKEVKIELTVDSVAAKDVHYTQDNIKDVIKKINR